MLLIISVAILFFESENYTFFNNHKPYAITKGIKKGLKKINLFSKKMRVTY